jgi:hypothetical protein
MGLHGERLKRWLSLRRLDAQQEAVALARVQQARTAGEVAQALVAYLWQGQRCYTDKHGTAAYYPGEPSIYGARCDAIEGVTRLLPLWAAYVGWPHADPKVVGELRNAVAKALDHGTDPGHKGYWGDITHRSTLICEAADVALCAWLLRHNLHELLPGPALDRLLAWLAQAVGKETADNNWHLFVAFVDACLAQLRPGHQFSSQSRLRRVDEFRVASGCFRDGPQGRVDFYNAWAFHYLIFWLRQMDTPSMPAAWHGVLDDFCSWYRWLFGSGGLPLFGRSLCYRFAAPVPLLARGLLNPGDTTAANEAAGHFCALTKFFAAHGGLRDGCFSQGVLGADVRWVDPYSGPASALWGSRAAVLLLVGDHQIHWGRVEHPPKPPIPRAPHSVIEVPGLGASILVDSAGDGRCVEFEAQNGASVQHVRHRSPRDKLRQWLRAQASRPQNNLLDMGWRRFESDLREYR